MKNWKLVATAWNLEIPEPEIERIIPALDALEAAFRPLAGTIPAETEPAVVFRCPPEDPQ